MSERMDDAIRDLLNGRPREAISVDVRRPLVEEYEMAAREVLWKLDGDRELGQEPGSFVASLIETMCLADPANLRLLVITFPAMGGMILAYKQLPNGLDVIRNIARGPRTP